MVVDEPLLLFQGQYLQCLDTDFLTWPPVSLLKQPDALSFLFKRLFDTSNSPKLPPAGYQLKVLNSLFARIENLPGCALKESSDDQQEPWKSLSSHRSHLDAVSAYVERDSQHDAFVSFNCVLQTIRLDAQDWRPITLLEPRSLVVGSKHTGHRTWEGALHLATFLLTSPTMVADKTILELGAGTGLLSILCAKYLGAKQVRATDGDEKVVQGLDHNLQLNGMETRSQVSPRRLVWGQDFQGTWVQDEYETRPFDVVLGADIIYDKTATEALVKTLRMLVDMQPRSKILMSNAVRFPDVFALFRQGCEHHNLRVREIEHEMTPLSKQKSLFYSTAMPLQILEIGAA
ncbi:putative methyltransferase-domain-containing protein [Xylariales sp. AK1849]|nr:putative methyltransferase-domain-containing protein [Xylariales sp. AK1849]